MICKPRPIDGTMRDGRLPAEDHVCRNARQWRAGHPRLTGGPGRWVGGAPAIFWTLQAEFWFHVFYPFVLMTVGVQRKVRVALVGIGLSWYFKFAFEHGAAVLRPFSSRSHTSIS